MRVHVTHLAIRVLGTILGVGFIVVGLVAVLAGGEGATGGATGGEVEFARERATAFGIMAMVSGVAAIFGSWAEKRVHEIWCAHPRRWWRRER